MKNLTLPTYEDVAATAERIKGFANKTPVLTSRGFVAQRFKS